MKGNKLFDINGEKGQNEPEADFLVINYTHQYILNVEVKKWTGEIKEKHKNTGTKTKDQLERIKYLIENWFSADLQG